MPFFRVMSRKKAQKKPLFPRKNLLLVIQFQGKGDQGDRRTLFLKFGEVAHTAAPTGGGTEAKGDYRIISIVYMKDG